MDFEKPNYVYEVEKVVRVLDGDTIDIILKIGFYQTALKRLRFLGIDTSELRGGTDDMKVHAKAGKARLKELLDNAHKIYVRTIMDKTGSFGRLLAYVYVEDIDGTILNASEVLLNEGFDKKDYKAPLIE